ncbi:hypothetical protein EON63_20585 [archaeon]|nr:MAG: hypothetical protein EON63_20585 [archaeon]
MPSFWVHLLLVIDYFTSWELFNSSLYAQYHKYLVSRLPVRPELPMTEIPYTEATTENIWRVTKGFTWPVIVRGLLGNTTAVQKWGDPNWWMTNYPNEEVLCTESGPYLALQVCVCV